MNPRDAEAALRKALELDPQNGCARIELGALYEDRGIFAQAAAEFERAIAIEPDHGGAHCQLGRIYRRQGRASEAEAALRKALELDPRNGWARFELGVLFQDQGRFVEAAAEFESAIAVDQNQGWVHYQLGRIYRRLGRYSEAEAALRKTLELDPQNGGAQFELGALYADQKRFIEAAAEFERAIGIDPNMVGAHGQLGLMCRRQGRLPEAEAALRRALELDPRDAGARIELGALYADQRKFIEAAAEFERAIAISPDHGEAYLHLGKTCRGRGRLPEAEAAFEKALALDPRNDRVCVELGFLYKDQERFPEAEAAFQKAVACDPRNGGAHFQLGNVYRQQGRWREAEAEFKAAISIDPEDDRAYVGLWAIYRSQELWPEAEAALDKAVAINPRSAFACTVSRDRLDLDKAAGGDAADSARERALCLLPWTHLHFPTDGSLRPCCAWSGPPLGNGRLSSIDGMRNSPGMKALRLDMMSGRPVAGCRRCYEDERSGFWSMRQRFNIDLSRYRDRVPLTAPDGTLPRLPVPWLDIRLSNICNLRCRTCDARASSAWAADARALGLPVEGGSLRKPYDDWDSLWRQLRTVLEEGVEEIRFAGGEPLIMEEHYRILDFLIARGLTDVRLCYQTNFSTLRYQGRDVIDLWARFRDVHVAASLDGSGRRGEYMRKGLSWDAVVANREEMLRRCPDVSFMILATVSIFNALHLPDLHREWVRKGYIQRNAFVINLLADPRIYSMQVLPAELKQRVLESYQRHQDSFLDADGSATRDFAAAARFMAAQDCSGLLPEFVTMTRRLDQLRGEDCGEVFPELAALFEAAA